MVVTYYVKLFCTRTDKQNGILMSLVLLVPETIITGSNKISKSRATSETFCGLEFKVCKIQGINVSETMLLAANKQSLKVYSF